MYFNPAFASGSLMPYKSSPSTPEASFSRLPPSFASRRCGVSSFLCPVSRYDHDPVIVGNNRIAWIDSGTRADDRNIHRTDRCLDRPFGAHAFAPHRKAHFRQDLDIADARVDDQRSRAPRLEAGG